MKNWLHVLASAGLGALAIATPAIHTAISSHTIVTTILGVAWAVLGNLLPSPVADHP